MLVAPCTMSGRGVDVRGTEYWVRPCVLSDAREAVSR